MKYGCHNRAPYKEPHCMSPNCEYTKTDLGKVDARCVGCKWREQNELAIPDTSTNTVDVEADQGVREATARQDAGGSAVSIEAMKLALEALENATHFIEEYAANKYIFAHHSTIKDLRQAIEQAQKQEPVAYAAMINGEIAWDADYPFSNEPFSCFDDEESVPLYTSPPQRQPLTDEDIYSITGVKDRDEMMRRMARNIARAIEAAHGIKEQE